MRLFLEQLPRECAMAAIAAAPWHEQLLALADIVLMNVGVVRVGKPKVAFRLPGRSPRCHTHVLPNAHRGRAPIRDVVSGVRVGDTAAPGLNVLHARIDTEATRRVIGHVGDVGPGSPVPVTEVALLALLGHPQPVDVGCLGTSLLGAEVELPAARCCSWTRQ